MAKWRLIGLGACLAVAAMSFSWFTGRSGSGVPQNQTGEEVLCTDRYTCYSASSLSEFGPGREIVAIGEPPPATKSDVAGVIYESQSNLTVSDAHFLNALPNLFLLGLADCSATRDFWELLDVSRLRYLYLDNSNSNDNDCKYIARGQKLEYVSVFQSSISKEGKSILKSGVPAISINDWYR